MEKYLDELSIEHKILNHDEMIEALIDYLQCNPKINKSDALGYNDIINEIDRKIGSCYFSAFHAPLIIAIKHNNKNGECVRFRLLKTKWLKNKLSFTYEFTEIA